MPDLCKKGGRKVGCFAHRISYTSLPSSQIRISHANLSACCVQGFLPSWVNVMYLNLHFLCYLLPETLVFLTKTMWHVLPLRTLMTLWLFDFPLLNFAEVRSGSLNLESLVVEPFLISSIFSISFTATTVTPPPKIVFNAWLASHEAKLPQRLVQLKLKTTKQKNPRKNWIPISAARLRGFWS